MQQIRNYFPELTSIQIQQFEKLFDLFLDWNSKINVISRKDMDSFYEKHVLHSLAIAKIINFRAGTKILDVGTGGGFPGIPLAIMFPECNFTLVDSIGKKITVVKDVSEVLNLKNVIALNSRAENVNEKFDFVVSRAVTKMDEFVTWVEKSFKKESYNEFKNGIFYLKGGDLTEELQNFKKSKEFLISDFFQEAFFETKKIVYLKM